MADSDSFELKLKEMNRYSLVLLFCIFNLSAFQAQTCQEVNTLLTAISQVENSKEISQSEAGQKLIACGEGALRVLPDFFNDPTPTEVYSDCQNRNLTKGEVAIIMADRLDRMPYGTLTGVQNCTLTFCEGNANFIEYYLPWIVKDGVTAFTERYREWLEDPDRIEFAPFSGRREKRARKRRINKYNKQQAKAARG